MLPEMLKVVPDYPDYQFVVAGVSSIEKDFYKNIIGSADALLVVDQTYELLQNTSVAVVTSGTATLETALFTVPEIVCYKANQLSYLIARRLVKVKYISLVNLVMDKMVVKELIQSDMNKENISKTLAGILRNGKRQKQMLEDYDELRERLGNSGASEKAADAVLDSMKGKR